MEKLKSTISSWIIVYTLITGILYALNQWLQPYPIYLKTLVLSGLMVFTMQYLVTPAIQKFRK